MGQFREKVALMCKYRDKKKHDGTSLEKKKLEGASLEKKIAWRDWFTEKVAGMCQYRETVDLMAYFRVKKVEGAGL